MQQALDVLLGGSVIVEADERIVCELPVPGQSADRDSVVRSLAMADVEAATGAPLFGAHDERFVPYCAQLARKPERV
jgi:hypothetical protein